jgi:hypothetical protein
LLAEVLGSLDSDEVEMLAIELTPGHERRNEKIHITARCQTDDVHRELETLNFSKRTARASDVLANHAARQPRPSAIGLVSSTAPERIATPTRSLFYLSCANFFLTSSATPIFTLASVIDIYISNSRVVIASSHFEHFQRSRWAQ